MTGIPTTCRQCGAPLGPRNITALCAECKLIARNERLSSHPANIAEPVSHDQAIENVAAVLGGRPVSDTANQAADQERKPTP